MENKVTLKNLETYKSASSSLSKQKYSYALRLFVREKTSNFTKELEFSQIPQDDKQAMTVIEDMKKIFKENQIRGENVT